MTSLTNTGSWSFLSSWGAANVSLAMRESQKKVLNLVDTKTFGSGGGVLSYQPDKKA